ncbi:MAG: oligosaccharide flippase family protein, partial [Gemmatimonadetes bacterium]|nr:oligosaccharide flippase family protein [Gemmatimonadota bacterium]
SISRSLLARDLRFQALAWIDGLRTVFTTVVTLVLAWMGFRYWSLVIGSVFSTFFAAVVAFWLRPFRPRWPRPFADITSELAFGWNLVVSRIAWYGYSNADFAVVGRVLGTAALGAYNIGWTMASLPVEKISVMVMKVTPSVFARVQDDLPALRRYVNRLTEGLSVVTLPAAIGMALVARDFVTVVLGDKWLPAVVPLQILSVFVTYRSVTTLYADILEATDHTRLNMMFSVLGLIVLPACFVMGTRWGTTGVAAAWAVGYPLITLSFHLSTTFRIIELRPSEYFASMWPAASSTAVMAVFVLAVQSAMGTALPGAVRLTASVLVGALAYAGALWVMHRRRIVASLEFVRSMRTKKKPT